MTKEEFTADIKQIGLVISEAQNTKQAIIDKYLSFAPFKKGDKVVVTTKKWDHKTRRYIETKIPSFIRYVSVGYDNEYKYELAKVRKDGQPAENSAGIYTYESIEHYEKEKDNQ